MQFALHTSIGSRAFLSSTRYCCSSNNSPWRHLEISVAIKLGREISHAQVELCCGSLRFALVPAAPRLNIDELRESAVIKPSFEEDAGAKVGGREGGKECEGR